MRKLFSTAFLTELPRIMDDLQEFLLLLIQLWVHGESFRLGRDDFFVSLNHLDVLLQLID